MLAVCVCIFTCVLVHVFVLALPAGEEPDMCSTLVWVSRRKTFQFVLDMDFECQSPGLLWSLQLTLELVSGAGEVPLRIQPESVWPLQISSGRLIVRQRFM